MRHAGARTVCRLGSSWVIQKKKESQLVNHWNWSCGFYVSSIWRLLVWSFGGSLRCKNDKKFAYVWMPVRLICNVSLQMVSCFMFLRMAPWQYFHRMMIAESPDNYRGDLSVKLKTLRCFLGNSESNRHVPFISSKKSEPLLPKVNCSIVHGIFLLCSFTIKPV